jgi:mRNA-degrading endonuclease RelE of RelBE toxin-antitoxin system
MNCRIFASPDFVREFKRLSKRYKSIQEDYKSFLEELTANQSKTAFPTRKSND